MAQIKKKFCFWSSNSLINNEIKYNALLLAIVLVVSGCEDKEAAYDSGYGDGYAVGYNTTCQIRRTLIEGNWSSESYSKGYEVGMVAGINACNATRRNSN